MLEDENGNVADDANLDTTDTTVDDNGGEDTTTTTTTTDTKPKPTDAEAKLLKELMKHKEAAKKAEAAAKAAEAKLEGIDIEAARAALVKLDENENKELERKGEYDRLLQKQKEAATAKIKAAEEKAKAAEIALQEKLALIDNLTLGTAFANSKFVTESLTLTPNKTKALYGDHFELKDGVLVAYDKPKGAGERTPIVDETGSPVSFDKAIESIINADPDKDYLIKSTQKTGAGSKPNVVNKDNNENKYTDNFDKIVAGLDALAKNSKKV